MNTLQRKRYGGPVIIFVFFTIIVFSTHVFSEDESLSKAEKTATHLIEKVKKYSLAHPEVPGSIPYWKNAIPGIPLLVHSYKTGNPLYYIVPVKEMSGTTISLIGIDASTFLWLWYGMVHENDSFPRLTQHDAHERMKTYYLKYNIPEEPSRPLLTRLPDNQLYWWSNREKDTDSQEELFIPLAKPERIYTKGEIIDILELKKLNSPQPENREPIRQPRKRQSLDLPAEYDIENVPFYYQEESWYCGEAALQMIFDYYGPLISQYDIGDVANEDPGYGTYSGDLRRAAHFSYISRAVQNPSLAGYAERELGYGGMEVWWSDPQLEEFRYEDVKKLIWQNYPVLVLTWFGETHESGHFRVVKGYNDSLDIFIVHDPWYGEPGGPDYYFSQSYFVDNLWTYSGRWGCFVAPWTVILETPDQIPTNTVFSVSCSVKYLGPSPFENQYPASDAQITLSLPQGYSLVNGASTQMCPSIGSPGSDDVVSWMIRSPAYSSVFDTLRVKAKGFIEGLSGSYSDGYADWIGGTTQALVTSGNNIFYYVGYTIDDDEFGESDGNADKIADAGETLEITIDIGYIGDQSSTDITASLSLAQSHPHVSIVDSEGRFGNIEGDTILSCFDGFVLAVSQDCIEDTSVLLNVTVTDSENRTLESTFEVPLNAIAEILLVCDDDQENITLQHISSLNSCGRDFDAWDVSLLGPLNEQTVARHGKIIWFTGDEEESTLTETDQHLLEDFLHGGGSLFLSGQNIGRDLVQRENGLDFFTNVLHADFLHDVSGDGFLQGVTGDPITGQYNLVTLGAGQNSPDVITTLDGACPIFQYYSSSDAAALRYSNEYHLVYFAFGFEGLSAVSGSSEELRSAIMSSILRWFDFVPTIGDVNEDGQINIIDVIWTVNIVLDLITPSSSQEWAADFNQDSTVNIIDAIFIVNYILGR